MLSYKVRFIMPVLREQVPMIYMPVWRFHIRGSLRSDDPDQLEKARLAMPETVPVIAFKMHGLALFGDLNLTLVDAEPSPELVENPQILVGCRRSSLTAQQLLSHIVMAKIDKTTDITGLDLVLHITRVLLVGYPFYDFDARMKDAVLGQEIYSISIDDLPAIRAACHAR